MGRIWMKNYPGLMRGLARAAVFRYYAGSFTAPPGTDSDALCSYARSSSAPFHPCSPCFVCDDRLFAVCPSAAESCCVRSIIKRLIIGLIAPSITGGTVDFRRPDRNNLIYVGRTIQRPPPHRAAPRAPECL